MSRRIFYGRGKAQIELSGGVKRAVDRVLNSRRLKHVADRLEEGAREVYQHAYDNWPEKSGKSKAALEYGLRIPDPTTLEAYVGFDPRKAAYHFFIREKYPNNNRRVWRKLVRTPGRRMAKRLAGELRDELQRAVEGR